MRLPLCLVLLLGFGLPLSAEEPAATAPEAPTYGIIQLVVPSPPAIPAPSEEKNKTWDPKDAAPAQIMTSFVHRLEHASAAKVASQVSQALQQVHCLDGAKSGLVVDSPVVIVPDATSNSLIVAASAEYVDEVKEQIAKADAEPRQFKVNIRLKTTDENGEQCVSSPQIITLEGTPSVISVKDGEGVGYELQVEVSDVTDSSIGVPAPPVAEIESESKVIPTSATSECTRSGCTVTKPCAKAACTSSSCTPSECTLGASTSEICSSECEAKCNASNGCDANRCEAYKAACKAIDKDARCNPERIGVDFDFTALSEVEQGELCDCQPTANHNQERIGINFDYNTGAISQCRCASHGCEEVACETSDADECLCSKQAAKECPYCARAAKQECCSEKCSSAVADCQCPCSGNDAHTVAASHTSECECCAASKCPACVTVSCECESKCACASCECSSSSKQCANCCSENAACKACSCSKAGRQTALNICEKTICPHCGTGIEITVRELSTSRRHANAQPASHSTGCSGCKCQGACGTKRKTLKQSKDTSASTGCPFRDSIKCLVAACDPQLYRPAPLHECEEPSTDVCATEVQRVGHRLFQDDNSEDEVVPASIQRHVVAPMIATVYAVPDLVTATDGGEPLMTPEQLVELIQRSIASESWEQNGGPAGVEFFGTTLSLVIRQDRETQSEIAALIKTLRELQELKSCDVSHHKRQHTAKKPVEVE